MSVAHPPRGMPLGVFWKKRSPFAISDTIGRDKKAMGKERKDEEGEVR